MRILLIFLFAISVYALRLAQDATDRSKSIDKKIKRTTIENISDEEISAPDMNPVKHSDFNVSILAYKDLSQDGPFSISNTLRWTHSWEGDWVKKICTEFIQHGGKGNILDIGGNIGSYALPLAACLKENGKNNNRVITIEGAPWNAKHLRAGIKYNNLDNIDLYEYALGSPKEGDVIDIIPADGNQGHSHVRFHKQIVQLTTIDEISRSEGAQMQNILVMKIDIEGHEMMAFEGATNFFKNGPCFIFIELKANHKNLVQFLQNNGYIVHLAHDGDDNAWCERKDADYCISNLV